MTFFHLLAYLCPLLAGFGVAAALALTWERPAGRRAATAGAVAGGTVLLLLLAGIPQFGAALRAAVVVVAFAALVAGVFWLAASCRIPPAAAQAVACGVAVLLVGSVFIAGPAVAQGVERGMSSDAVSARIGLALDVNPFMVLGYSVFDAPLLHDTALYPLGLADYPFAPPAWGATSLGYLVAAAVLAALAAGISRLTRAGAA